MIKFTKMHGLGNDFAVVDATHAPFTLSSAQIQQMANRRLGIGFDQMLVIESPKNKEADFHFRIFNADGSEAGQCGNGARCVAAYIRAKNLSQKDEIKLSTISDSLRLRIEADEKIKVWFSVPRFQLQEIPFVAPQEATVYSVEVDNKPVRFSVVNVGNPHAVITVEHLDCAEVQSIGEQLSKHAQFPEGVNVGFMQIINPQHIRLRVYERGTGETLACGSGACAAMVVGRRNGWLQERVTVSQPGGSLTIDWPGPNQPIVMTGPAKMVYEGEWNN